VDTICSLSLNYQGAIILAVALSRFSYWEAVNNLVPSTKMGLVSSVVNGSGPFAQKEMIV
jgi:hypothetical protein